MDVYHSTSSESIAPTMERQTNKTKEDTSMVATRETDQCNEGN